MAQPAPVAAPLQVVGVCGQTVDFVVQGAVVRFTCLPPGASPGQQQPSPPKEIFMPGQPAPPHVAAVIELEGLEPDLLVGLDELDPDADPLVVPVKTGEAIAIRDLGGDFSAARQQGRVVLLEID
jgi:hypothetical protein